MDVHPQSDDVEPDQHLFDRRTAVMVFAGGALVPAATEAAAGAPAMSGPISEDIEKLRVREVLERYFYAVDSRSFEDLVACFAERAEAQYHLGSPDQKSIAGGRAIAQDVYAACSRFTASNHNVSNLVVRIAGDRATANTFAVANVLVEGKMLVRGLRYEDILVRETRIWRIEERRHTPLWQLDFDAVAPKFL